MSCLDMFEFYFVHNLLHQEMERCLGRCATYLGLSVLELQILWIASRSKTTTLADMAKITAYSKAELKELVTDLERDDLVKRVRSEESLCVYILTTDKGKHLTNKLLIRPKKCSCPACSNPTSVKKLTGETRKLVVELRGRGACDLIADLARLS